MKKIFLRNGTPSKVDDSDFELLSKFKWYQSTGGYAFTQIKIVQKNGSVLFKTVMMHRMILKAIKGKNCDHIDGDRLNNQRENLRCATFMQNAQNRLKSKNMTSRFKGVSYSKNCGKWRAEIRVNKSLIYLGVHEEEVAAAKVYNAAALHYFGDFSKINEFPEELVI